MRLSIFHLFVVYLLCALIPLLAGQEVPADLQGRWETTHEGYEEVAMEITGSDIIFKNGPDFIETQQIVRVRTTTENGKQFYTITYRGGDGSTYSLAMQVHTSGASSVLRLKNQAHIVWTKTAPSLPEQP